MRETLYRWAVRATYVAIGLIFAASAASMIAGLLIIGYAVVQWLAS